MKLTWFGGTTLRVYLGGEIVVVDAASAPADVDRGELLAGADRVVRLGEGTPIDPAGWRPKPAVRGMDELPPLEVFKIAGDTLLIAAAVQYRRRVEQRHRCLGQGGDGRLFATIRACRPGLL